MAKEGYIEVDGVAARVEVWPVKRMIAVAIIATNVFVLGLRSMVYVSLNIRGVAPATGSAASQQD